MSDRWVDTPPHVPHKCHRVNTGHANYGPYFEHSWTYYEADPNAAAHMALRELTLYQSAQFLREMFSKPGSPFVIMERHEHEEFTTRVHVASERASHAEEKLEAAYKKIAELEDRNRLIKEVTQQAVTEARQRRPRAKAEVE